MVQEQHYGVWGERLEGLGINGDWAFLFQGKEYVNFEGYNAYDFHTRSYDPWTGRFNQIDGANQFASGYTGMGNMPTIGVDPDGQFVNFLIGAVMGGVSGWQIGKSQGAKGWGMFGYIVGGAALGGFTSGVGSTVSAATASWGTVGSGIASGAFAGATAGGFGSVMAGGDFLSGAGKGALWGGVFGGLSGAVFKGKPYEDVADLNDELTGKPVSSLDDFAENWFPGASKEYGVNYNVASENSTPPGYKFDSSKKILFRADSQGKRTYINGVNLQKSFGKSEIWISQALMSNDQSLLTTLGHELIHAWHRTDMSFFDKKWGNFIGLTESSAHNWSAHQNIRFGLNANSSIKMWNQFYKTLSSSQIAKYRSSYHWQWNSYFKIYSRY